ncbi:MAG: NAD(P)/FAD-dependent oxidoreductase [Candidatus Krumholzibacteriia bacterium]
MRTHGLRRHRVVIVGGGFGGLYAARYLGPAGVDVTVVDKRNFHLFQPLLYQVATGGLSPGDISSPLRGVLKRRARVWQAEATGLNVTRREVVLRDGRVPYDTLVLATGVSHDYFGNDTWAKNARGLKSIEDALDIRRRIFLAFEVAEREADPGRRQAWTTFAVIGGGPTGVELAGALAELAHRTLKDNFRNAVPEHSQIHLVEAMERVLPQFPPSLSVKAERALARLGVTVRTHTRVTSIDESGLTLRSTATAASLKSAETWTPKKNGAAQERLDARTVLWAAGVRASPLGAVLAKETGASLDRAGRVWVEPDLTVPGHPEIFVIGDLAVLRHRGETTLPGIAPVAMQQGRYVARLITRRLQSRTARPFQYRDKGTLAVIGRNRAVADFKRLRVAGYPAWLTWLFVHIWYLIGFDNKLLVMIQWAFDYLTRKRGARLITGEGPPPPADSSDQAE